MLEGLIFVTLTHFGKFLTLWEVPFQWDYLQNKVREAESGSELVSDTAEHNSFSLMILCNIPGYSER